jgi:hypothetical protein
MVPRDARVQAARIDRFANKWVADFKPRNGAWSGNDGWRSTQA